tara:strand:+ start:557 stop:727 length:171 start_codon:yes stop_codon:yes gene_type:complete
MIFQMVGLGGVRGVAGNGLICGLDDVWEMGECWIGAWMDDVESGLVEKGLLTLSGC